MEPVSDPAWTAPLLVSVPSVEATELLLAKARAYELTTTSLADAASVAAENESAAVAFTVAAIVPREVAHALEEAA